MKAFPGEDVDDMVRRGEECKDEDREFGSSSWTWSSQLLYM